MSQHLNLSVVDLSCQLEKASKYSNIKKELKQASEGRLGHPGLYQGPGVSYDFNRDIYSFTFNVGAALNDHFV